VKNTTAPATCEGETNADNQPTRCKTLEGSWERQERAKSLPLNGSERARES
jgi:hypothetical protein